MYELKTTIEKPKTEQEKYRDEIHNLTVRLYEKATEKLGEDGDLEIQEKIANFSEKLSEEFPECNKYAAWHGLAGSTISNSAIPVTELDFLGEYNVKNFLGKLLAELENLGG